MSALLDQLRGLFRARRDEVDRQYSRTLPFGDYVSDRWEKASMLGFGEGASIYDSAYVFGDVKVGPRTWIGPFVILDGSGGLEIGANCSISASVQIYSHDTVDWAVSGGHEAYTYAATRIGDNCYIGPNSVIAKGVTIGSGCVIGAGSVVLSDIAPGQKAYGTPCRMSGPVVPKSQTASPTVG